MGLANFHGPAEGVLPMMVINTVMSVALIKNMLRSLLKVVVCGAARIRDSDQQEECFSYGGTRPRRVSIMRYSSLCRHRGRCAGGGGLECCVCLSRFEADEEVSELFCEHFFHKGCLDKWFDHSQHITCPLCRSTL